MIIFEQDTNHIRREYSLEVAPKRQFSPSHVSQLPGCGNKGGEEEGEGERG